MISTKDFAGARAARLAIALATAPAALALPSVAAAQATYTITELASADCGVAAINNQGDISGGCSGVAATWENGVQTTLGRLAGGTYSTAAWTNAARITVGNGDTGDSRPKATLYRNGKVINIDPSAANAYAMYINDAGVIVGNRLKGFTGCTGWSASIFVEDSSKPGNFRRTDLQPYPSGDSNARCEWAAAANQSLQVVGWVQSSLFGQRGAFWNNDSKHTLALLQPFGNDWTSIAWAVNDLGQAVGESNPGGINNLYNRPVMWDADAAHTPINLPMLGGDNYGSAIAINNRGQVLGSSTLETVTVTGTTTTTTYTPTHFVVWRDGGVFDLQSLLDATGAGWEIRGLFGINDQGQIVGSGMHNGQPATFVMTPAF